MHGAMLGKFCGTLYSEPMFRRAQHYLWYTSALISFCWFITAMYLPIIPGLTSVFGTTDTWIKLMISSYFIAFCLSQIYWGPVADNYPRHLVVFLTLNITLVGSVLCLVAPTMPWFTLGRVIQGFGIGALPALSRSIIHERCEAKLVLRYMVYLTSIVAVATSLAPLLGAWLLEQSGWRSIFSFLVGVNVLLLILNRICFWHADPSTPTQPAKRGMLACYWRVMSHRHVLFHMTTYTLMIGSLVAFYSASPFVFIDHYHLSPSQYGWLLLAASAFYILAVIVVRLLLNTLNQQQLLLLGLWICLLGAISMVAATLVQPSLTALTVPIMIYLFGAAFIPPVTNTAAMEALPELAATTSSLMGAALALGSGLLSYWLIGLALRTWLGFSLFFLCIPCLLLIYHYWLHHQAR